MPVFWILVVLLLLIIFFLLFPAFGKIGDAVAKHLHLDESDVKNKESKDIK